MIVIEDDFIIDNEFDCVFPISYELYYGKELKIATFERFLPVAKKFESLFGNDPFNVEAINWIHENFCKSARDNGYEPDEKAASKWILTHKIDNVNQINRSIINNSTIRLDKFCRQKNLTTFKFDELFEQELTAFATSIDGKIVSIASENYSEYDNIAEITVETAPDYRKKGYAASNIAALAECLINDYELVAYNCSCKNIASQKSAVRAGFINDGKAYYYVCYKK